MSRNFWRYSSTFLLLLFGVGGIVFSAAPPSVLRQQRPVLRDPAPVPSVGPYNRRMTGRSSRLGRMELRTQPVLQPMPSIIRFEGQATGPRIRTGFEGIGGITNLIPPDTHIAVGPGAASAGRVIESTNSRVQLYDKTGVTIAGPVNTNTFYGAGSGTADPKVLFDQGSGRFFAILQSGITPATSKQYLAVSTSSTPNNLTSDWIKMSGSGTTNIGGINCWIDFPGIGSNATSLFVTYNLFDSTETFKGMKIRIFNKSQVLAGNYSFVDINIDDSITPISTTQPAHVYGSTDNGNFYLITRLGPTAYRLFEIAGAPTNPVVVSSSAFPWSAGSVVTSGAPQSGSSVTLDTISPEVLNAVYRNGALWMSLTSDVNSDGSSDIFWAKIATNGGSPNAPTIADTGFIQGSDPGAWAFIPSINVNAAGDAAIVYSQSSPTQFSDMRFVMRTASDPPGTFQSPTVAKASAGFYDSFLIGNPDRWGDFAACVVDPDDNSFWFAHEFVKTSVVNNSAWGTFIARSGTSPTVVASTASDAGVVTVTFLKNVNSSDATTKANFTLESPIGTNVDLSPPSVTLSYNATSFTTTISGVTGLVEGNSYKITVRNVRDLDGNPIVDNGITNVSTGTVINPSKVKNTRDAGTSSLREAMNFANANPATTIKFEIPTSDPNFAGGVFTITPVTPLPPITADNVIVDGSSEITFLGSNPNTSGGPPVVLSGINLTGSPNGLMLSGSGDLIKMLNIQKFLGSGVQISGNNARVTGCFIGISAAGTAAAANGTGITVQSANGCVIGGTMASDRNILSGNTTNGITLSSATGALIQGNSIGTQINPSAARKNNQHGIRITGASTGNTIDSANTIAFNGIDGVQVAGGTGNAIRNNSITGNTKLGINLIATGENTSNGIVTPNDSNDADAGPNNLQNWPQLTGASIVGTTLTVQWTINSTGGGGNNATYPLSVQFYTSATADPSGNGEGQTIAGTQVVNGPGNHAFTQTVSGVAPDQVATAVATDASGNSSEFSNVCVIADRSNVQMVSNTADSGAGSLREALMMATSSTSIIFKIPKTDPGFAGGVFTIQPSTALPSIAHNDITVDGTSEISFLGSNPNTSGGPPIVIKGSAGIVTGLKVNAGVTGTIIRQLAIHAFTSGTGIEIVGSSTTVTRCWIGTTPSGGGGSGNLTGIKLLSGANNCTIGATITSDANVISANSSHGLQIASNSNQVRGNRIGTNDAGTAALGNGLNGVLITGANNSIGKTASVGLTNTISGNGTLGSGTQDGNGIRINGTSATGNQLGSNRIGTNSAGTSAIANMQNGVRVDGGATGNMIGVPSFKNTISGNSQNGVLIDGPGTNSNLVRANSIGTTVSGSAGLPNGNNGIAIINGASNNTVGGVNSTYSNTIAFNTLDGANIDAAGGANPVGNQIIRNSIVSNTKLGINLVATGESSTAGIVTPNDGDDSDMGVNNLQNFPVLSSATLSGSTLTVMGSLSSTGGGAPNATYPVRIDIYSSPSADPSGNGEGKTFITTLSVSSSGPFTATKSSSGVTAGQAITAVATDAAGNSSEFSSAITATSGSSTVARTSYPIGINLIALPINEQASSNQQLLSAIADPIRAVGWDVTRQQSIRLSGTNSLGPSGALWVRFLEPVTLPLDDAAAATPAQWNLSRGWNLVGNPGGALPFDATRIRVIQSGSDRGTLKDTYAANRTAPLVDPFVWIYDNPSASYQLVTDSASGIVDLSRLTTALAIKDSIPAGAGCWIFCRGDGVTLQFDDVADTIRASRTAGNPQRTPASMDLNHWAVQLIAQSRDIRDGMAVFGVLGGSDGSALLLAQRPPPPALDDSVVRVSFERNDGRTNLAYDMRPFLSMNTHWNATVTTNLSDEEVVLRWPRLSTLPTRLRFTLVDLATGTRQYMNTTTAYRFQASQGNTVRRFRIEVSTDTSARLLLQQVNVQMLRSAGIPRLLVACTLTRDAEVTVRLISPSGKLINQLPQQVARTGLNSFVLDASDTLGRIPSRGVYLIDLTARTDEGEEVKALKHVMIK